MFNFKKYSPETAENWIKSRGQFLWEFYAEKPTFAECKPYHLN